MVTTATPPEQSAGMRVRVQKFGTFLSNMIMPNIPALIAWGILTAFFIPAGWTPNAGIATLVGPTIHYLLPILIAATGGRMVYGDRGAVVGAFSVMGAIAGSDYLIDQFNATLAPDEAQLGQVHMFIGAMILGPLGAWVMKKLDALWDGKIRPGFEMLVNMFSAGITAFVVAMFGFFVVARVVNAIMDGASIAVNWLISTGALPLVSILIEPAKVFFLNNAINHGVLTPLGVTEADQTGKSIMFLLEANPGPGLGILLAYTVFGTGAARATAPGAAIIQFFGGIHEIYFPYVLMKPKLILAAILGGMTGVFINVLFHSGLRAPAAPGSIIAILAQTASDSYVGVILSVIGAAAVSFVVAGLLLKTDKNTDDDLAAATAKMEGMKGKKSIASSALAGDAAPDKEIHNIVFACDAGMGSSAMGASVLRKKIKDAGFADVTVVNKAIANLTDTYDLVVTHRDLADRAARTTGSAVHVSVDNFMSSPKYDEIVELLQTTNGGGGQANGTGAAPVEETAEAVATSDVLSRDSITLHGTARTRDDAITEAGRLLVAAGAVAPSYVDAMHEREASVSTFMGNGLAIPHGTNEAKGSIDHSAMSFIRYDEPIDWNGKPARFVVGIAGAGDDHLVLLRKLATVFADKAKIGELEQANSVDDVLQVLDGVSV